MIDPGWISLAAEAVKFIFSTISKYLDGDQSTETRRVIDVLPLKLRSRILAEARRVEAVKALAEARGERPIE